MWGDESLSHSRINCIEIKKLPDKFLFEELDSIDKVNFM